MKCSLLFYFVWNWQWQFPFWNFFFFIKILSAVFSSMYRAFYLPSCVHLTGYVVTFRQILRRFRSCTHRIFLLWGICTKSEQIKIFICIEFFTHLFGMDSAAVAKFLEPKIRPLVHSLCGYLCCVDNKTQGQLFCSTLNPSGNKAKKNKFELNVKKYGDAGPNGQFVNISFLTQNEHSFEPNKRTMSSNCQRKIGRNVRIHTSKISSQTQS